MEEEGQRALATCQAAIKETDTGDDQPNDVTAEDQVGVVELDTGILGVDIDCQWVATSRVSRIKLWLMVVSKDREGIADMGVEALTPEDMLMI